MTDDVPWSSLPDGTIIYQSQKTQGKAEKPAPRTTINVRMFLQEAAAAADAVITGPKSVLVSPPAAPTAVAPPPSSYNPLDPDIEEDEEAVRLQKERDAEAILGAGQPSKRRLPEPHGPSFSYPPESAVIEVSGPTVGLMTRDQVGDLFGPDIIFNAILGLRVISQRSKAFVRFATRAVAETALHYCVAKYGPLGMLFYLRAPAPP